MINLEHATLSIEQWIETFVEVPHPALGGWPPCPYAKKARLERDFDVRIGMDPYFDLKNLAHDGLTKSVVIFVYDPQEWPYDQFSYSLKAANEDCLLDKDIIALEDHPADLEWVNGVCMNQGTYAMAMCQSLSDLNVKAQHMASKDFYHNWPEDYLAGLFQYRKDPRQNV